MVIGFVEFLQNAERIIWGFHILGVVFGLGAATVTDVMFVSFMRNFRVERREAEIMETLSKIVWVGIGLLLVSGLLLWIPQWEALWATDRFLMKMTAFVVVLINGVFLNFWIQPRARRISFVVQEGDVPDEELKKRERLRKGAFALGGISFVAWYGTFALAVLNMLALSYLQLLLIFVGLMIVAIVGSQLKEWRYQERVTEELDERDLDEQPAH